MQEITDVHYDSFDDCRLDLYLPEKENFETVVYFHGGGLTGGHKNDYYYVEMARDFANAGIGFVSVEYRKYPNVRFPDYICDCAKAVKWVKDNIVQYGGKGSVMISGQSAGAWISLMLCFNTQYLADVGVDAKEITAWIIDSAQTTSHFNVIQEEEHLDELCQRIDKYAPLYYVNKATSFSKMLLLFYAEDMPCRPEQNMLLYKNILAYNKDADISYVQLPGSHCAGSTKKDDDGEYPFVKAALHWLTQHSRNGEV